MELEFEKPLDEIRASIASLERRKPADGSEEAEQLAALQKKLRAETARI